VQLEDTAGHALGDGTLCPDAPVFFASAVLGRERVHQVLLRTSRFVASTAVHHATQPLD
jgi:hypothetical protein